MLTKFSYLSIYMTIFSDTTSGNYKIIWHAMFTLKFTAENPNHLDTFPQTR